MTFTPTDTINYTLATGSTSLTVNPAPLTITADPGQTKVYGQTDPASYAYTITSGLLVGNDALSGTLSRVAGENVGTYAIGQNDLSAGSNYTISFTGANLSVTPAPLTVTATDASKDYGAALPTLAVSYSGLVNNDLAPATLPTISTTATNTSPFGTYPITATGAADPNYTITYTPGTLTVNPVALTITASNGSMTYGGTVPTITPAYNGLQNSDIAPATPATCSTMATGASAVGSYSSSCSGTVDSNYTISYLPGSVNVTPATLTVTADPQTKVYGSANPTLTGTISGIQNSDSVTATYSSTADTTSPVGVYDIVPVLSGAALSNYSTPIVKNGTLTITPATATLTLNANDLTQTYDGSPKTVGATIVPTGLSGVSVSYTDSTGAAVASPDVGTYGVTATLANSNYTADSVPGSLVINANLTALNAAKTTAQGLITTNAPESTTSGNHIVGSLATLSAALTATTATSASAQSVVDSQTATLNNAITAYNAAIVPAPAGGGAVSSGGGGGSYTPPVSDYSSSYNSNSYSNTGSAQYRWTNFNRNSRVRK